jgi:hypothetical protein
MPDRMKTFIYILIALIAILLLFDIKLPKKTIPPTPTPLPQTEVKAPEKPVRVPTSAEYLQGAKKSIKNFISDSSKTSLDDAYWKLSAIEPKDPDYKEAQELLKKVRVEQQKLHTKEAVETEKTTAVIRKEYAKQLEFTYLDKLHMDTTVTVSGKNNTTIKIKWILWSRVSVHEFLKDGKVLSQWREMGFKRYVLDGGYGGTWSDSL